MTVHSSIKMTPTERFSSALIIPRFAPPLMPELFRCRCERKVSEARTVKINSMLYEVPVGYSKKKLELRYFYIDSDIEAFYQGKSLGFIHPVNMNRNVTAYRKQTKKEIK